MINSKYIENLGEKSDLAFVLPNKMNVQNDFKNDV